MSNTISESLRRNQQFYILMSKVQSNFALTQTLYYSLEEFLNKEQIWNEYQCNYRTSQATV